MWLVLPQPGVEITGEPAYLSWQEGIRTEKKKRGVPWHHAMHADRELLPQICVVSEYILWKSSRSNKSTKGQWILVT